MKRLIALPFIVLSVIMAGIANFIRLISFPSPDRSLLAVTVLLMLVFNFAALVFLLVGLGWIFKPEAM